MFNKNKKVCLSQSSEPYLSSAFFNERLIEFYKLNGYLTEDSYIRYETATLILIYDIKNGNHLEWKDPCGFQRSKVAYIPAERDEILL